MTKKQPFPAIVLGMMSGTSLDGLDLALCEFHPSGNVYSFKIHQAHTVPYTKDWKNKLSSASTLGAEAYFELNAEYGRFMADQVLNFLKGSDQQPVLLASHGHTVFHQPHKGFSTQLGCGATLAACTGISTVCDLRNGDVALGGQGAPLVPIGDKLLFSDYQACVNIGGIANISFDDAKGHRVAFDICEANLLLNALSEKAGKAYDENGTMAKSGKVDPALLQALNGVDFYQVQGAKSLGREWFEQTILPLLDASSATLHDQLHSAVEHIAMTIAQTLNQFGIKEALFSGGGACNGFLMDRIRHHASANCVIAEARIVQFKEALIFAFLGFLRLNQHTNALATVTAARRNSITGALYLGNIEAADNT